MPTYPFGPGTVTVGATPLDFSCEVMGGKVTHAYNEIQPERTSLCGTVTAAERVRQDGLEFNIENDLTAEGLYAYLYTNDLSTQPFTYTPNDAAAAAWEGDVQVTLPPDIGSAEYGAPITSTVTWTGVGTFTYTPATVTP